jgi:hypothetical protein
MTATVYNASIANNYFLSQWKLARIIMLTKPDKDHSSPPNYKPISLLSSLAEVFKKNEYGCLLGCSAV